MLHATKLLQTTYKPNYDGEKEHGQEWVLIQQVTQQCSFMGTNSTFSLLMFTLGWAFTVLSVDCAFPMSPLSNIITKIMDLWLQIVRQMGSAMMEFVWVVRFHPQP